MFGNSTENNNTTTSGLNQQQQEELDFLDIITVVSFMMQMKGWDDNRVYTTNLHEHLHYIESMLDKLDKKLDKLLNK